MLNSFGHPVPRIADTLQKTGRDAAAKVLKAELTDRADRLALDLRSAYPVPGLEKMERTFVFSRQGRGSLAVTDEVSWRAAALKGPDHSLKVAGRGAGCVLGR